MYRIHSRSVCFNMIKFLYLLLLSISIVKTSQEIRRYKRQSFGFGQGAGGFGQTQGFGGGGFGNSAYSTSSFPGYSSNYYNGGGFGNSNFGGYNQGGFGGSTFGGNFGRQQGYLGNYQGNFNG